MRGVRELQVHEDAQGHGISEWNPESFVLDGLRDPVQQGNNQGTTRTQGCTIGIIIGIVMEYNVGDIQG